MKIRKPNKPGAGRPRGPSGVVKRVALVAGVRPEVLEAVRRAAAAAGQSVSAWVDDALGEIALPEPEAGKEWEA